MAALFAILVALARGLSREASALLPVRGNNFVLLLLLIGPGAGFLLLLVGAVLLIPMASDPLSRLPRERLELWPLTTRQRLLLRLGSLSLSPLTSVVFGLVWWRADFLSAVLAVAMLAGIAIAGQQVQGVWLPRVPSIGALPLFGRQLRDLVPVLDLWLAVLLAVLAQFVGKRIAGVDEAMPFVMALVIVVVLSSAMANQFGVGHPEALLRHRLLGQPGWRLIGEGNLAFLLIAAVLTAPLALAPAMSAAFVALAVGNYLSLAVPAAQRRWRLAESGSLPLGLQQAVAALAAGVMTERTTLWALPVCVLVWVGSVVTCGWRLERAERA